MYETANISFSPFIPQIQVNSFKSLVPASQKTRRFSSVTLSQFMFLACLREKLSHFQNIFLLQTCIFVPVLWASYGCGANSCLPWYPICYCSRPHILSE